ncbi:translation initiation factor IF-2-like [Falco peregrinus]|uniref:translation initiation factor IF-2-like n=1 Tax=Falco peregrinus TaxID=8954 RepID=UPI0024787C59|nr:translation initiation factor IF-2-like [Falco peregrinus]
MAGQASRAVLAVPASDTVPTASGHGLRRPFPRCASSPSLQLDTRRHKLFPAGTYGQGRSAPPPGAPDGKAGRAPPAAPRNPAEAAEPPGTAALTPGSPRPAPCRPPLPHRLPTAGPRPPGASPPHPGRARPVLPRQRLLKSARSPRTQRPGGSSPPRVASSLGTCGGERSGNGDTQGSPGPGRRQTRTAGGLGAAPPGRGARAAAGLLGRGLRSAALPSSPVPLAPSFHSAHWRESGAGLARSPQLGWLLHPPIKGRRRPRRTRPSDWPRPERRLAACRLPSGPFLAMC